MKIEKEKRPIIDPNEPAPPDRSNESHDQAVERYLSSIPDNETLVERMRRIQRFRCGY